MKAIFYISLKIRSMRYNEDLYQARVAHDKGLTSKF